MMCKAKTKLQKKVLPLFVLVYFFTLSFFAQQKVNQPKSIYTYSSISLTNSSFALNNKLKLKGFDFVYVNLLDLDLNQFSIDFANFSKTPSPLIYDDYNAYRDENFLKGFRLENDPTRWNLQCPSPLSVQPTISKN